MRQQVVIDKAVDELQPRDIPILCEIRADDQGGHDEAAGNERKASAHAEQQQQSKSSFNGGSTVAKIGRTLAGINGVFSK